MSDSAHDFWYWSIGVCFGFGLGFVIGRLYQQHERKGNAISSPVIADKEFMGVLALQGGRVPSPRIPHAYTYQKDGPKKFSGPLAYIWDGMHTEIGKTTEGVVFERHHKSRWSIRGRITGAPSPFSWIDTFVAYNADPDMGLVWGTYDKVIYSETEEAFLDFIAHHPGVGWDGPTPCA